MKIQFKIQSTFIVFLVIFSCKKEPSEPQIEKPVKIARGMYILNEGLMNMNNAGLTYYSFSDSISHTDFFYHVNGRKLGDTGNDMGLYGSKIYIVVSVSSQIEVIEASSGISLKQISVFNGEKPRQPRKIAFYKNYVLVCNFDGTVAVIDTANYQIIKYITVGRNPDGIAVVGTKAYIANSGGLDAPNYDNTLSVIDLEVLEESKKITVGDNPYNMVPDNYGDLYVVTRGDYDKVKMRLQVIDCETDEVKHTFSTFQALNLSIMGDTAFVYYFDFTTGSGSKVMLVDVRNESIIQDNFIDSNIQLQTIYGIACDKTNSRVFISDAKGFINTGEVFCLNNMGKKLFSFKAGLNPGKMVFVY